ncbi:MAG TPA: hypothetical protein VN364_03710, partial [Bellilinea sp.]|nr:hypothetical protein [Bellilinea sp.]
CGKRIYRSQENKGILIASWLSCRRHIKNPSLLSPSEKGPKPKPYPLKTRLDRNYFDLEECPIDRAVVFTGSAIDAALLVDFVHPCSKIKIDPVLLAEMGARSAFTTFIGINAHFDHVHTSIYPIVK